MKIGIFVAISKNSGGIYQYTASILKALHDWNTDHEFVIVRLQENQLPLDDFCGSRWSIVTINPQMVRSKDFAQFVSGDGLDLIRPNINPEMEKFFKDNRIELMISPAPVSFFFEWGVPYIMAIHDLQHRLQPHFPEVSAGNIWKSREYLFRNGVRHAEVIMVDSDVGREDVLNFYGDYISRDRVYPLPFLPFYRPDDKGITEAGKRQIQKKYNLPANFLFYPAQFWLHKNHSRLIHALHILRFVHKVDAPLVLVGSNSAGLEGRQFVFNNAMLLAEQLGVKDLICYLGYVPDEDIPFLYSMAKALTMPTFFGPTNIPFIEAWAFGCPVLTSNIRGIREQVGTAGLLVDPENAYEMADGILKLWTDTRLERTLIDAGYEKNNSYTSDDFAQRLYKVIEDVRRRIRTGGALYYRKTDIEGDKEKALKQHEQAVEFAPDNTTFQKSLQYSKNLVNQNNQCIDKSPGKKSLNNEYPGISIITASYNQSEFLEECIDSIENMVVDSPQNISVSAVVSTCNSEKFIRGCLQDLLQQTLYKKGGLEIIVVDSGSSENEGCIIREFQKDYPKIKYIRTKHRETVYQAWNHGIKLASGKYITNANTDDRHRQDAFERMVNLLELRPDIVLVYADLLKTETPNETFENGTAVGRFTWYDWERSKLLNEGCFMGPQPMWRRSVHDIYGYFDEEFVTSGDYEFWLRISQTFNFHHIREPLGLYLIRPDSIEHREAKRKVAEDKKIHSMYSDAEQKGEIIRLRQNTDDEQDSSQLNMPIHPKIITGDNTMKSYEKFYQSIQPLLDGSNPENVMAALRNMVNSFPDFARAHNDLGVLFYQSGEKEKALNHYEKAAQLEPDNGTFKKNLADYYYVEQGRVEDALRIYVNLLEVNPQDVEILLITGHICVSLKQIEDARVFYSRVLEIEPWNSGARENLDQLEKMAPDFADNQTPEEMYTRIKPLMEAEDPQPAIDALDKLLGAAPDFALAHNDLGVLYYQSGEKEKALNHYEQAAHLEPGNAIFQKNLADFYFVEQGRVEDALKIYVDVLTAYPEDIETLLITGHICVSLRKFDDARVFYNRILEIEPWNADARQNINKLDGIRETAWTAPQGGETGRFTVGG